jgi:poly-gamma-glutamate synthesis protein (capsule biosynthesis protein)
VPHVRRERDPGHAPPDAADFAGDLPLSRATPVSELVIAGVGDVLVDRDEPAEASALVAPLLHEADVVFGNCEGVYCTQPGPDGGPHRAPSCDLPLTVGIENARGLEAAGFDVMSCANTHAVDGGHLGLRETLETLRAHGIVPVGAGENLQEARRPALVERAGVTVGFVASATDVFAGYQARENVPGLNPLRVHRFEAPSAIGPTQEFHIPYPGDVANLLEDVRRVREQADVVVVSFHWGEGFRLGLHEYERTVARQAIDAGADVVFAHHHHVVRGADLYRGKPIFHGLCHFIFDLVHLERKLPRSMVERMAEKWGDDNLWRFDSDYPLLPMAPQCRMTMIARVGIRDGDVVDAGIVPCAINALGQPEPLRLDSERGREIGRYLQRANADAGLAAQLERAPGVTLGGYEALVLRA